MLWKLRDINTQDILFADLPFHDCVAAGYDVLHRDGMLVTQNITYIDHPTVPAVYLVGDAVGKHRQLCIQPVEV